MENRSLVAQHERETHRTSIDVRRRNCYPMYTGLHHIYSMTLQKRVMEYKLLSKNMKYDSPSAQYNLYTLISGTFSEPSSCFNNCFY